MAKSKRKTDWRAEGEFLYSRDIDRGALKKELEGLLNQIIAEENAQTENRQTTTAWLELHAAEYLEAIRTKIKVECSTAHDRKVAERAVVDTFAEEVIDEEMDSKK
jgi:hypothetical protein